VAEGHETTAGKLEWLEELREQALHAGSEKSSRAARGGELLARERAEKLCDPARSSSSTATSATASRTSG
jgi:Acetyl-CoA carboxylase, carboxyltransferase component (subunits alpha and beta)